jgi:hypothetical protein
MACEPTCSIRRIHDVTVNERRLWVEPGILDNSYIAFLQQSP